MEDVGTPAAAAVGSSKAIIVTTSTNTHRVPSRPRPSRPEGLSEHHGNPASLTTATHLPLVLIQTVEVDFDAEVRDPLDLLGPFLVLVYVQRHLFAEVLSSTSAKGAACFETTTPHLLHGHVLEVSGKQRQLDLI